MRRAARWLLPLAAALCLGPAFWVAALRGAILPKTLALPVNVHGLPAPGYDGHTSRPLAPLSARIIADARQDAGSPSPAPLGSPAPSAPSGITAAPTPTPPSTSATPTSPGLPLPSPTVIPLPTPTALPLPTPTPLPLPTPTLLPLPTL